jgi:pentatricopeptide repeat protein
MSSSPPHTSFTTITNLYAKKARHGKKRVVPYDDREPLLPPIQSNNLQGNINDNDSKITSQDKLIRRVFSKQKSIDTNHPKQQQQQQQIQFNNDTNMLPRTLSGGTAMIFDMARRMLAQQPSARWHPKTAVGIHDDNPNFRSQPPVMTNQGYAGTIWRNVRRGNNKPSLYRYALRTFDRMDNGAGGRVPRTNVHYEGALLACAKLGLWERALELYNRVLVLEQQGGTRTFRKTRMQQQQVKFADTTTANAKNKDSARVFVTDNMILSLVRASVRAVRSRDNKNLTLDCRKAPLDSVVPILLNITEQHNLPLVARHLNPIAAAYQRLGLHQDAANLLQRHLTNRTIGPEAEDGRDTFNLNDVAARDKASYTLLVRGRVLENDWAGAIAALRDMTESGLYPNRRHLNGWTEVSERKTKHRMTRSWKKKRDELWLESVK